MWLFTEFGFYSTVENRDDSETLLVRSRAKRDMDALVDLLPAPPVKGVWFDRTHDYPWRAIVRKADLAVLVSAAVGSIDYDNFKGRLGVTPGFNEGGRLRMMHEVWAAVRVWGDRLLDHAAS